MQKFIVKYATAAHLAILAVAPLFLFPHVETGVALTICLWFSLVAAIWVLMEPSVLDGESLRGARRRVMGGVVKDVFFWVLVAVVMFAWARASNSGVAMAYDPETREWCLKAAKYGFFPGSVGENGKLALAGAVSVLVVAVGCRHALGKSARMAFLVVMSALASVAAIVSLVSLGNGDQEIAKIADGGVRSHIGTIYWIYALMGTVALVGAFEQKWTVFKFVLMLSIGGLVAGGVVFAPMMASIVFAAIALALAGYGFYELFRKLHGTSAYRMLAIFALGATIGILAAGFSLGSVRLDKRLTEIEKGELIGDGFMEKRAALSRLAVKSWHEHPWIGTGIGSFAFDMRFAAGEDDWKFIKGDVSEVDNGWLQLLTERGIVGAIAILVPLGVLLVCYALRAAEWSKSRILPMSVALLAPLALISILTLGAFDCSMLRIEIMTALAAIMVVSAKSFPRMRGR